MVRDADIWLPKNREIRTSARRYFACSCAFAAALLGACDPHARVETRAQPAESAPFVGDWSTPLDLRNPGPEVIVHHIEMGLWQRSSANAEAAPLPSVAFDIVSSDAETQRIVGRWHIESWHPERYIAVEWQQRSEGLYFCDLDPDALTPEIAALAPETDRESLEFGCLGTPWRLLQPPLTPPVGP